MNVNRMTEKTQEALQSSQMIAGRYSHQQIDPEHLLLALLEQGEGLIPKILTTLNIPIQQVRTPIENHLVDLPKVSGAGAGQMYMSQRLSRLLDAAQTEAGNLKDEYVSVEHLLMAMV